jgi:hypothetical protein
MITAILTTNPSGQGGEVIGTIRLCEIVQERNSDRRSSLLRDHKFDFPGIQGKLKQIS